MNYMSKILKRVEGAAARAQGKGYGSASIQKEVSQTLGFIKSEINLAIDIGGNVGAYAAELRRKNKNTEIHVFEPSSTNVRLMEESFKGDDLLKIVQLAVSDKSGEATLFSDKQGSGLGSLTKRKLDHFFISLDVTEKIKTIRFEDYWATCLNSRKIDLVKIDIEGHELFALQGFGDALKVTNVIQFEFGGSNIDTRTYFQDFWYFFADHGFDIYRITPLCAVRISNYSERDEFFAAPTNYIAVRRFD